MGVVNTFTCNPTDTVNINVSGSTQQVAVSPDGYPKPVRYHNDGTATVWINWGASGVTATVGSGLSVPAGSVEILTMQATGPLFVAAIAAGSTGKIYFTPGTDGL